MRDRDVTKSRYVVFAALLLVFVTGCTGTARQAYREKWTSEVHSVRIISISPDLSTALYVGENYDIETTVEYSFKEDRGSISLVIQRGEFGYPPIGVVSKPITKGEGRLTLKANITVPETKAVQVFTPLTAQGDTSTRVLDMRLYKVVDRRKQTEQ
ncbi:MAG: hypothetical protein GXP46_07880 [Deferribacteres bacterium]|nr:hypothetical protein [Deferribacteres bacterium]